MLGGAVVENFIIGAHFWGIAVSSPTVEVNGQSLGSISDSTLGLSGFGLNLTYYFMPLNLYLSATPSIGVLSAKQGGSSSETENGFALRLAVGKEWWVSDNWGIGLNVQYAHSSNKDKGTNPPTWGSNWFGVAFSATYN
jgi:opacity protein-like surface antigen